MTHAHHLTDKQKAALTRLEKKGSISEYERGQLVAFRLFGTDDEKKRADKVLARIEKEKPMHEILTSHPAYLALMEEVAKHDEAEAVWRKRSRASGDDYQRRLAEYREAKTAALLDGREPPPEPRPPANGGPDEARILLDRKQALRIARRDLLADLALEIEAAARARMAEIVEEIAPDVDRLQRAAVEVTALVSTVRECLLPAERRNGVPAGQGVADRMRHAVTVSDLVAAAVDGLDPFDPVEPQPARMVAANFAKPEDPKPSRTLPSQDRTPSPIQVKGA